MRLSSYKIFSVFGIDVELHWSFLLFIFGVLLIDRTFFMILVIIFIFVTAHEISHSIVSLRHGVDVNKIVLLPIGGMAMMDTTDMNPWSEIKMAVAGPFFNFAMAGLFLLFSFALGIPLVEWVGEFLSDPEAFTLPLLHLFVFYAFYANLILGIFNLFVPAFPLDGGRVVRGLLAFKYPYLKATEMAKYLGYMIAAMMFFFGTFALFMGAGGGVWIMVIAMFIGLGASSEYKGLVTQTVFSQIDVKDVLIRAYPAANQEETLERAIERAVLLQRSNLIVFNDEPHVLDTDKLSMIKREEWPTTRIKEVMKPVKAFTTEDELEEIHKYMLSEGIKVVPITDKGTVIGVVYYSDMQRMVEIVKKMGYIKDEKRPFRHQ